MRPRNSWRPSGGVVPVDRGCATGVAPTAAATKVRFKVVTLTVALAFVTYLDRVCISKLAPEIMRDLGLSKVEMG